MNNDIYRLFLKCFPEFPMPEEMFLKLLDADNCTFVPYTENGTLAGCGAVYKDCVRLLCVDPDFRGKGIGSNILKECEKIISDNGYDRAVLGGDSDLFIGAVTPEEQWNDMHSRFFEREGYSAMNGCLEMKMDLAGFDSGKADIPPCPEDVTFGYITAEEKAALHEAVSAVDPDWVKYFTFDSPIYAAKRDGKIVGFCIIDEKADTLISTGDNNVGVIGCVGVIPEARRNGIGLTMVTNATQDIKDKGCDISFIHYTHLDWWYGKLGYETFLRYWLGSKELNK